MSLFKPATLKQLYVLAVSLSVPVYAPLVAQAEKGYRIDGLTSDLDVVTDVTVNFDNYFEPWSPALSFQDKFEISTLRVGSEVAAAALLFKLAGHAVDSKLNAQNSLDRFISQLKTPQNKIAIAQLKRKKFLTSMGGSTLTGGAIFLIVDGFLGTVVAMNGNKPVYFGNAVNLAKYLAETKDKPALSRRAMNSRERHEFEDALKTIQKNLGEN